MLSTNDKVLVNNLQKNKPAAFAQLVYQHSQYMYTTSYQFLKNEADSQDCVQKAFIQVFKYIDNFRADASFKTWLYRITVNCALMALRSRNKQPCLPLDKAEELYKEYGQQNMFIDNSETNIEKIFERTEKQKRIQALILLLPKKHSTLIQLRDIQELSTKATADILDMSEAAVKTQLHRARQALKLLIDKVGFHY